MIQNQNNITRLFDILLHRYTVNPKQEIFNFKTQGVWKNVSMEYFIEKGNALSKGFLQQGIKKGDLVVLVSTSRYEWHLIDFAISQIGAVCVPLYTSLTAQEYAVILSEAKTQLILVSNANLYQLIQQALSANKQTTPVYSIDEIENVNHYEQLFVHNNDSSLLETCRKKVMPEDLLCIIYTSGTEGNPKGVMLSHSNIVSNILSVQKILNVGEKDVALTFLPLNHIYEKTVTYFFFLVGCKVFYAESLVKVFDNIKEIRPTIFTSIPLMMKKIYDKIIDTGSRLSGFKKKIFMWSVEIAKAWDNEKTFSLSYFVQHKIADVLVYKKWRQALGGRVQIIASGSAAINPLLIRVFNAAGLHLLEGYGLTETSPVVAVNLPPSNKKKIGTVGTILEGVSVKIAPDGEILVKGPNVMLGYYLQKEKTKEVLTEDGWFSTGDIGKIIWPNFLKITDRKKELFKTSGGKYVSPQYVEGKLKESLWIENAMVVGANEAVVAAFIQPNWELLKTHCQDANIAFHSPQEVITNTKIIQLFQREIENANAILASHEQVRRFQLVPDTWSIQSNELTPTLKLKRRVIFEQYKHLYEILYRKNNLL